MNTKVTIEMKTKMIANPATLCQGNPARISTHVFVAALNDSGNHFKSLLRHDRVATMRRNDDGLPCSEHKRFGVDQDLSSPFDDLNKRVERRDLLSERFSRIKRDGADIACCFANDGLDYH